MFQEGQKDVLVRFGFALLLVQSAERLIKTCITYVLPKDGRPLTLEMLEVQLESERKKTLGYFLGELRKRADIHADFDAVLSSFLTQRNTFIHNIDDIAGFDLKTDDGIEVARKFADGLLHSAEQVLKVFTALLMAWQRQVGGPQPFSHPVFRDIETNYLPLVDRNFRAKEDPR